MQMGELVLYIGQKGYLLYLELKILSRLNQVHKFIIVH